MTTRIQPPARRILSPPVATARSHTQAKCTVCEARKATNVATSIVRRAEEPAASALRVAASRLPATITADSRAVARTNIAAFWASTVMGGIMLSHVLWNTRVVEVYSMMLKVAGTTRRWILSRRDFLTGSAAVVATMKLQAQRPTPVEVKALVFDTFGTVVDWRSSVADEIAALAKQKGVAVDGAKFADAWRAGYGPSMNRVRTGELPWTKLDALHRMTLDCILVEFRIDGLSEVEKVRLNHAWHRLRPWPDAVAGLTRLKKKFIVAPLSNGNVSLMTDLAKHAGQPGA